MTEDTDDSIGTNEQRVVFFENGRAVSRPLNSFSEDERAAMNQIGDDPGPDDTKIWRYLNLAKFLDLLFRKSLAFIRADCLGDPFEGTYDRESIENRRLVAEFLRTVSARTSAARDPLLQFDNLASQARRSTYVSCWHRAAHESYAMWRIYGRLGDSIAIQTRVGLLRRSLPKNISLRSVLYRTAGASSEGFSVLRPFFVKDSSYAFEDEVRAAYVDFDALQKVKSPDPVQLLALDLSSLIERVVLAPGTAAWYGELVREIVATNLGDSSLVVSSVLDRPRYVTSSQTP